MNYQQDTADIATVLITPTPFSYTLDLRFIVHSIPRITSIRYSYYTLNNLQDNINIPPQHSSMNYQYDIADIATALIMPTPFSYTLDLRIIVHSIPRITWIRYCYYTLHKLQVKKDTPLQSFNELPIGYCPYRNRLIITDSFLTHFRLTDHRAFDPMNNIDQVLLLHFTPNRTATF